MSFCWVCKVGARTRVCEYDLVRVGLAAAISGGRYNEEGKQIDALGVQQVWKLGLAIQIWRKPNSSFLSEDETVSPYYQELICLCRSNMSRSIRG